LNSTKIATGSYPSPYGTPATATAAVEANAYNKGKGECIRVIRDNPNLSEEEKIKIISQMNPVTASTAQPIQQQPARLPLIPMGLNAPLANQQAMTLIQQHQQWQQQQFLIQLQSQQTKLPTKPVSTTTKLSDSNSVGNSSNSDSESESGHSQTETIFRPW